MFAPKYFSLTDERTEKQTDRRTKKTIEPLHTYYFNQLVCNAVCNYFSNYFTYLLIYFSLQKSGSKLGLVYIFSNTQLDMNMINISFI